MSPQEVATRLVCTWAAITPSDPSLAVDVPWSYGRLRAMIAAALTDAVQAEREACARVAELYVQLGSNVIDTGSIWRADTATRIAAAIRGRA